jgi:hypothetical protein
MKKIKESFKVIIRNNEKLKNLNKIYDKKITELEISIPGKHIEMELIPNSIESLKFYYDYENLPCEIPPSIKSVYFYEYYHLIEDLPITIENIEIYKGFNHPVDKLNNNIKYISFGWNFNQPIDNLPTSLEKIILGPSFTHSINNLPSNVKFIHINNPDYDYLSILKLPKSILLLQLATNEDFDLIFSSYIEDNFKYVCCLEKNLSISNSYNYSNALYFKNYYFYQNS